MTLSLVRRAKESGYQGIFLTVDSVRFGFREADARNGWKALIPPHRLVNYDQVKGDVSNTSTGTTSTLDETYNSGKEDSWDQNTEQMFNQNPTWEDVRWLKKSCGDLPLIIKGVIGAVCSVGIIHRQIDCVCLMSVYGTVVLSLDCDCSHRIPVGGTEIQGRGSG